MSSPASIGWCSIQVITLSWTFGGGLGCSGAACQFTHHQPTPQCNQTPERKRRKEKRTSTRSHAHTFPSSSPHTTLASPCPKHAQIRYDALAWPLKSFSILPVDMSMRRAWASSVVARYVWLSCEGTTAVTGADERWVERTALAHICHKKDVLPMKSLRSSPIRRS